MFGFRTRRTPQPSTVVTASIDVRALIAENIELRARLAAGGHAKSRKDRERVRAKTDELRAEIDSGKVGCGLAGGAPAPSITCVESSR